jgi:hypothetical protein
MPVDKEYASLCFPAEFSVKVLAICNFVHLEKEKLWALCKQFAQRILSSQPQQQGSQQAKTIATTAFIVHQYGKLISSVYVCCFNISTWSTKELESHKTKSSNHTQIGGNQKSCHQVIGWWQW